MSISLNSNRHNVLSYSYFQTTRLQSPSTSVLGSMNPLSLMILVAVVLLLMLSWMMSHNLWTEIYFITRMRAWMLRGKGLEEGSDSLENCALWRGNNLSGSLFSKRHRTLRNWLVTNLVIIELDLYYHMIWIYFTALAWKPSLFRAFRISME